jgi:hypothetical protein
MLVIARPYCPEIDLIQSGVITANLRKLKELIREEKA